MVVDWVQIHPFAQPADFVLVTSDRGAVLDYNGAVAGQAGSNYTATGSEVVQPYMLHQPNACNSSRPRLVPANSKGKCMALTAAQQLLLSTKYADVC
jgi:hypothetical protein